jgi:hypothetical protein
VPDLGATVTYTLASPSLEDAEPITGSGVVDAISVRADDADFVYTVLDPETGSLTDVHPRRGDVISDG